MATQSQETYNKVRELLQPLQNQGILSSNISYCFAWCTNRGCRDRDRMVVGFTTSCAKSAYHH